MRMVPPTDCSMFSKRWGSEINDLLLNIRDLFKERRIDWIEDRDTEFMRKASFRYKRSGDKLLPVQ